MSRSEPHDFAIGAAIRQRRQELKLSLAELGERCGLSGQQLQKYEHGLNRISVSRLVAIAQGLGARVADLVGDIDNAAGLTPERLEVLEFIRTRRAVELLRGYAGLPDAYERAVLQLKTVAFDGGTEGPVVVSLFPPARR